MKTVNKLRNLLAMVLILNLSLIISGTAFAEKKATVGIGIETKKTDYVTAKDWPEAPSIEATGAVLIEAKTGQVLYAKNADTAFYPASITKIMTALLTIENCKMTDKVTFEGDALQTLPAGYVSIAAVKGEKMLAEDWMNALLVLSANDAANALAAHVGGTIADFADMMNERAKEAGAKNTHFANPSGLHEEDHYTTPYDMAMIMRDCIKYDDFIRIAGSLSYTIEPNNKRKEALTFATRHQMLPKYSNNYYEYAICGKTGYTTPAGNTLITYAEKDGMQLICCVMKCGQGVNYASTKALFDYGFDNFSVSDISTEDARYTLSQTGIFTGLKSESTALSVTADSNSYVVLPKGVELESLDTKLTYLDKTDSVGGFANVSYSYEGMKLGSAKLILKLTSREDSFNFDEHETLDAQAQSNTQTSSLFDNTIYINIWYLLVALIIIIVMIIILILRRKKRKNNSLGF